MVSRAYVVTPLGKSEHVIITLIIRLRQENSPGKLRKNLEKFDVEKLKASTDLLDWVTCDENADVEVI